MTSKLLTSKSWWRWLSSRKCSSYKKVPRPDAFKLVSRPAYEPPSLEQHLADRIRLGGPMSVADYMRAVVSHPKKGYYMQGDVFGSKGDFTTSPEISPFFGELMGVWTAHELRKIGSPRPLQLIELGPGRGTLLSDVMRVLKQLPPGDEDISIHLVEISERLAQIQAQRLGAKDLTTGAGTAHYQHAVTSSGHDVYWYRDVTDIPPAFCVILAHEFFDALPIHKLQKVDNEWREVLVSLKNPSATSEHTFELVVSRKTSPAVSRLIPANDSREHVEVCPQAGEIISHVADRLEQNGGVMMVVDYGHEGTKTDTFRGFKNHALHPPLLAPGTADLTADVDFSFLKRCVADKLVAYGPVTQEHFLTAMGIQERLKNITDAYPEQKESLESGVRMLVEDMGPKFFMLALFPAVLKPLLAKFPAAGFV